MNMSSPTSPTYGHFRWDVDDPDYDDVADYDDDDRIQTTRSAGQQPAKFGSGDLSSDGSDVVSPGERDVGELYERTKFERQLEQKIAVIEKERSTMISNMWKDFERRLFDGDAATMERDGGRREGRAAVAGRVESRDTLGRSGRPGPQDARTLGRRAIAAGYYRPYYDISSSAGKLSRQEIDRSLDELLVELAMTTAPDRTTSRLNAAISGVVVSNSGVRMRPRAASCNRKSGADERRRYENMAAVLTGKSRSHTQLSRTPSTQNGGGAAPPSGGGSQQLLDQVLLRQNQKQTEPQSPTARPLTCYMPVLDNSLDLRRFVETSGHCLAQCNQVQITSTTCHGYLSKLQSGKLRSWKRRWFVFDRTRRCLFYYSDKTESLRSTESGSGGGAIYFQSIQDVYVDHLRTSKSARPDSTFCVKTIDRPLYLMAPSPEAMRIWIDVIFTGAEAYQQYV